MTDSATRLKPRTLIAYGISDLPVMLANIPMMLYLNAFYAKDFGLDLVDMANMLLFARVFDLITDPLVGYLSDHTKTRWGRRKPWMVASLPVLVLGLYQVLVPSPDADLWYLVGWMMVMQLGWTMLMIPYYAWGAELSKNYDERTRIAGWRAGMGSVGQLIAIAFPFIFGLPLFVDMGWGLTGFADILRVTAYAAVILVPLCVFTTIWRVKEAPNAGGSAMEMMDGLKVMAKNGSFRWLVITFMLSSLGLAVMMPMNAFYVTAVLDVPQMLVPTVMFFGTFASLLGLPFWMAISKRFGKHRAWIGGLLFVTAFSPMYLFLGPGDFWYMVPFAVISAFGTGSFMALPNAMKADVIDIDTARTGENRAAMFFSAWSLTSKAASSLGGSLGLWALALVGFDATLGPANSADALMGLKLVYVFLPAIIFVSAGIIIWKYPLNKERQERIRAAIDRRQERCTQADVQLAE